MIEENQMKKYYYQTELYYDRIFINSFSLHNKVRS
jgi:hypothetical protein